MKNLTEENLTESVLERISDCQSPRLKFVMRSLITHLHAFAREVRLSPEEWRLGIEFLTAAGHITDDKRQEFILLSDTLGLSALVDLIENRDRPENTTESSLLGPFYRAGAPELPAGASIANGADGEPIMMRGVVRSIDGPPIAGALLDVWQTAPNGLYDVQEKNPDPMNMRGRFRTDRDGRYQFRSAMPVSYSVPADGPVGKMLRALGRHSYRPAHVHFIVSAPGHETLTTALYLQGDKYLESDAVFGSRSSLAVSVRPCDVVSKDGTAVGGEIDFDFVLNAAGR